jgi:hypothetical protein
MRIAFCLSGMMRNFENTFPGFKKYIAEIHNPDIFFYGYPNNNGLEYCEEKLKEMYEPKKYFIQEYSDVLRRKICPHEDKFQKNTRCEVKIGNSISQFYNIYGCDLHRQQYERENNFKYDVVIRSRIDVFYFKSFDENDLKSAKQGNVLIPSEWDFKQISNICVSDSFAMSNSNNMSKYSNIYNHYEQYFDNGVIFHPETLLGTHLLKQNLNRVVVDRHGWYKFENPDSGMREDRHGY